MVTPTMSWQTKFLYHNAEKAFDLNREILLETDFSDTDHIRDMLLQLKTGMERDLLEASNTAAKNIGLSAGKRIERLFVLSVPLRSAE